MSKDHAELLEKAAEAAHNAWWQAKKAQGFHAPGGCEETWRQDVVTKMCPKCHKDMRPYADLDEPTKELDRAHVRAVHEVYASALEASEHAAEEWARSYRREASANAMNRKDRDALAAQVGMLTWGIRALVESHDNDCDWQGCGCDSERAARELRVLTPSTAAKEWERMRSVAEVARKVVKGDPALSGFFPGVGHVFLRDALAALDAIRKEKP